MSGGGLEGACMDICLGVSECAPVGVVGVVELSELLLVFSTAMGAGFAGTRGGGRNCGLSGS